MLKRLFVSIGRKKRIDRKMKYLNQLIGRLNGRMKIDFALKVVESVAVAKNSQSLEELAEKHPNNKDIRIIIDDLEE